MSNSGFPLSLLSLLRCPRDAGFLTMADPIEAYGSRVLSGRLVCGECAASYLISDGIVDLVQPELVDGESEHERRMRDEKALAFELPAVDWRTATPRERLETEIYPTLEALQPLASRDILELGCGKGDYTLALVEQCASLIAVDLSGECLRVVAKRLPADAPVGLVRADAANFRTEPSAFDIVFSTLVSNLPGRAHRSAHFKTSAASLKPSGRMFFGVHHHSLLDRLNRVPQAGRYTAGGIFRYYFRRTEILKEAAPFFSDLVTLPIQVGIPGLDHSGIAGGMVDRLRRNSLIGYATGKLLLVSGRPNPVS